MPGSNLPGSVTPTPLLVYRDRIGAPSEIQFLRRQYVGFTRLTPVWIGRHVMPQAPALGGSTLLLGGDGPGGWLRRAAVPPFRPCAAVAAQAAWRRVLHAQFARGGALALPLAQALGLRLVVTLHGGDVSKAKNWRGTVQARRWPAVRRGGRRASSASLPRWPTRRCAHGVPRDKLVVLPIGVEVPDSAAAAAAPGRPATCSSAASCPRRASACSPTRSATCARPATRPRWSASATARNAQRWKPSRATAGGVTLTGWLPPEAVAARMAQAWSLLVPSVIAPDGDAEGLPSVIPEAMAQACPIIGSAQGGIAEAVQHERTPACWSLPATRSHWPKPCIVWYRSRGCGMAWGGRPSRSRPPT